MRNDAMRKPVEVLQVASAQGAKPREALDSALIPVDSGPHGCPTLEAFENPHSMQLGFSPAEAGKAVLDNKDGIKRSEAWNKIARRWLMGEGTRYIAESEFNRLKQFDQPPFSQAENKAVEISVKINNAIESERTAEQFIGDKGNHADIKDPDERRALYLHNYLKVVLRDPRRIRDGYYQCHNEKIKMTRQFFHPDKLASYGVSRQDLFDLQNQVYVLTNTLNQSIGQIEGAELGNTLQNIDATTAALTPNTENRRSGFYDYVDSYIPHEPFNLDGEFTEKPVPSPGFAHPDYVYHDRAPNGFLLYHDPKGEVPVDPKQRAQEYKKYADERMKAIQPLLTADGFIEGVRWRSAQLTGVERDNPSLPGKWDQGIEDVKDIQVVRDEGFQTLEAKATERAGEIGQIQTAIDVLAKQLDDLEEEISNYLIFKENHGGLGGIRYIGEFSKKREAIVAKYNKATGENFKWQDDDRSSGDMEDKMYAFRAVKGKEYRAKIEGMAKGREMKGDEMARDYMITHTKPPFDHKHPEIASDSIEVTVVKKVPPGRNRRLEETTKSRAVKIDLRKTNLFAPHKYDGDPSDDYATRQANERRSKNNGDEKPLTGGDMVEMVVADYVATAATLGKIEAEAVDALTTSLVKLTKQKPGDLPD